MEGGHVLTVKEAAEQLRVNPITVQRWLRSGRLRGARLGGKKVGWRIPEAEVRRLLTGEHAGPAESGGGLRARTTAVTFQWGYRPWAGPNAGNIQPLLADEILDRRLLDEDLPGSKKSPTFTVAGMVLYAEQAYLACRILMLANRALHLEALYCAGQAVEKYMKAIRARDAMDAAVAAGTRTDLDPLDKSIYDPEKDGHRLCVIAEKLAPTYGEFAQTEFLKVCERLDSFEVAGRYPDHKVKTHWHALNLLTFLDEFVVHCRELLGLIPMSHDFIRDLLNIGGPVNVVQLAAARAILERNERVRELMGYSDRQLADVKELASELQRVTPFPTRSLPADG
jgi:excisionase family DNA binding protein